MCTQIVWNENENGTRMTRANDEVEKQLFIKKAVKVG